MVSDALRKGASTGAVEPLLLHASQLVVAVLAEDDLGEGVEAEKGPQEAAVMVVVVPPDEGMCCAVGGAVCCDALEDVAGEVVQVAYPVGAAEMVLPDGLYDPAQVVVVGDAGEPRSRGGDPYPAAGLPVAVPVRPLPRLEREGVIAGVLPRQVFRVEGQGGVGEESVIVVEDILLRHEAGGREGGGVVDGSLLPVQDALQCFPCLVAAAESLLRNAAEGVVEGVVPEGVAP